MGTTSIEWTDVTWNPTVGCTKVSPGCAHCFAERMAKRLKAMEQEPYQNVISDTGHWTGHVHCLPERLEQPLHWRKPSKIFVNSMSDLFHEDVPFDFILQVWMAMASTMSRHTYQILTKRPDRMKLFITEWLPGAWGLATMSMELLDWPLPSVWLGVSVENQQAADERIPLLLQTPAAVRFVSVEPMLGEVDLTCIVPSDGDYSDMCALTGWAARGPIDWCDQFTNLPKLDWVIAGCESGPHARPMEMDWARSLRDQCQDAHVPYFLKQMTINGKLTKMPALDGQVWAQYPEAL